MRPAWRADLKWVFALVCLLSVIAASFVYSAHKLTGRDTATGIFAAAVGGLAATQIEDEEWESIREDAAANPSENFLVPGFEITVPGSQIADLTKDEAVQFVVQPVAQAHYDEGSSASEPLLSLEGDDGGEFSLGPIGVLTRSNHDALTPYLVGSLIIAAVSATLLFTATRGPGRAGSVCAVVALGTAGCALGWWLIDGLAADVTTEDGAFAKQIADAIAGPAGTLSGTFLRIFFGAAAVTGIAIASHFSDDPARRAWSRFRGQHTETDGEAEPGVAPPAVRVGTPAAER